MWLDKRIKDKNDIQTVVTGDDYYVGDRGWFGVSISDFHDLECPEIFEGKLLGIDDNYDYCFVTEDKEGNMKQFPYFIPCECSLTDDSYMTIACAKALLEFKSGLRDLSQIAKECFQSIGREYQSSYGKQFHLWLISEDPKPYNSFGNGSAMRISPVAYVSTGIEEVKTLSRKITEVSHNHPEGIKGAEATAIATYLALSGIDKNSIKKYISDNYYNLDFKLDDIRDSYEFDGSCQGTVPYALEAFFESSGFEDAIRNAISIGGDSDTIGAICGGVAGAYYGVPEDLVLEAKKMFRFKEELLDIIRDFEEKYCKRI